jgi:hypothetical protein
MLRFCLLILIFLLMLGFVTANAKVTFIPDREITLPDSFYINNNTTFEFTDLNDDYVEEIIVENESIIASYSLKDNETIDYFIKPVDTMLHKYTWGYIDNDSLLDFVKIFFPADTGVEVCIHQSYYPEIYRPKAKAIIYLSGNSFLSLDTIILIELPPAIALRYSFSIQRIKRLFWEDTNSDGIPEIYFQLQISHYLSYGGMLGMNRLLFLNYKYIIGDDSAQGIEQMPEHGLLKYPLYEDSVDVFLSISDSIYFYHMHTHAYHFVRNQWSRIRIFNKDTILSSFDIGFLNYCDFEGYEPKLYRKALLSNYLIDDFVRTSTRYELIAAELQYFAGISYLVYDPNYTCTTITHHLVCYDLSSPDMLTEIWRIDYNDNPIIGLIFSDTVFIDRFFTYRNNRFYLHNSENGEIVDSSNIIHYEYCPILDYRAIDACEPQKMAIFIDGNNLKFYKIGIMTSVEDEISENLIPITFHLGQPYPNPYNAQLSIPVDIARKTNLQVEIYNILGQHVEQVFNDRVKPGELILSWDSGQYPSGIYFIRARTGLETQTTKAVLLK